MNIAWWHRFSAPTGGGDDIAGDVHHGALVEIAYVHRAGDVSGEHAQDAVDGIGVHEGRVIGRVERHQSEF
jgi:hypothetical protein